MPITKSEFQSPGHNMEKELVEMQIGGLDLFDERSDAKMLHSEDKRAFALREREFGRLCDVQDNIRFFFQGVQNRTGGSRVQVEVSVEAEEHVERLVRCTHVLRGGNWQQVSREVRE